MGLTSGHAEQVWRCVQQVCSTHGQINSGSAEPPQQRGLSVEVLEGIHELNRLLLVPASFCQAEQLSQLVLDAAAALQQLSPGAPHVTAALCHVVAQCEPASLLALQCLTTLAATSPPAQDAMAAHGLLATLVGLLLGAGNSLEPPLRSASLRLLHLMVVGRPARVVHDGAGLSATLRVVASCLAAKEGCVDCSLGLDMLQELACFRKVLDSPVLASSVAPALAALAAHPGDAGLQRQAEQVQRLLGCMPGLLQLAPGGREGAVNCAP